MAKCINVYDNEDKTPLLALCSKGGDNVEEARMLLQAGAEIHSRNSNPLLTAMTNRNFKTMRLLYEHGANVNERRANEPSAIQIAIR